MTDFYVNEIIYWNDVDQNEFSVISFDVSNPKTEFDPNELSFFTLETCGS
jgi:hypothetical protein